MKKFMTIICSLTLLSLQSFAHNDNELAEKSMNAAIESKDIPAMRAMGVVCGQKAISLAKAVYSVDNGNNPLDPVLVNPGSADQAKRQQVGHSANWTFVVSLENDGKMDFLYKVQVRERGPSTCDLVSISQIMN